MKVNLSRLLGASKLRGCDDGWYRNINDGLCLRYMMCRIVYIDSWDGVNSDETSLEPDRPTS